MNTPSLVGTVALLLTGCLSAQPLSTPRALDRAAWRSDYLLLRGHLDAAYANLEFAAHELDLPALDARTQATLSAAATDDEARAALVDFLTAFHDPHLRLAESGSRPPVTVDANLPAPAACTALGYGHARAGAVPWNTLPAFTPLPSQAFLNGLLTVEGRRVGVIRFGAFGADRYLDLCLTQWQPAPGHCDRDCQRALRKRVEAALVAEANAALDHLIAAGAQALVLDVTGNGGGNSWVDLIARRFPGNNAPCPRSAMIKHPHTEALLREQLHDASDQGLVARKARLVRELNELRTPCDRSGVWKGQPLACTGLVDDTDEQAVCTLGAAAGAIALPTLVMTDGLTASAAEALVARLKDYGSAHTVGTRTMGAGCGMTAGGNPITLPHSKLTVELPDCVRYRRDGRNERAGIEADVELAAPGDEGWAPAVVLEALERALVK